MAASSSSVYEGDVIFLYCNEARGYVYSDPPGSKYSRVTVFTPEPCAPSQDPGFPNIHFAAFQILPSNAKAEASTLRKYKGEDAFTRSLVYGRKIKLLHMASRKYLSFASPNEAGNVQPIAYLVDWRKEEADESLLRVLPAETGIRRQRGEDVLPGDTIRLECVMPTGHHILVTENAVTSRYEVKRAVTDSVFTIHMHISWHEKIPRRAIRGATVVLIHNLENEVYLSGEGSIASKFLRSKDDKEDDEPDGPQPTPTPSFGTQPSVPTPQPGEAQLSVKSGIAVLEDFMAMDMSAVPASKEVVARKPRNIHGFQRISLSGNIFWQLEDFCHPMNGDWVQFGKPVRIKHVPSQRYLAVVYRDDKPDHLTLKDQCSSLLSSPEFAFLLVQTVKKEERLTKLSYVEIRHVHGEHVRSVIINTHCNRLSAPTGDAATGLEVEQFDRIYSLSLVDPESPKVPKRQLLFKIEEVRNNFVNLFYHVLGVTKTLMSYAEKSDSDENSSFLENSQEAVEMVKMFGNWVKQGQNCHVRAEMLRIAKAVDVMMALVRLLDAEKLKDFLGWICVALERFVTVGGRRCCFYLAKQEHIDLLLEKVGCGIKAENVLSALAKDEMKVTELLVHCLVDSEIMKSKLKKKLEAPPLNLLSSLCFSEGRPVRSHQGIILQTIMEGGKSSLLRTKVDPEANVVMISSPKGMAGKPLGDLNPRPRNILVAQIKLFSRVCKGVNKVSIRKIVEEERLVTIEEAFMCIKDKDLNPALRSAYIDFIISTLVDVNVQESGTTVENIWHTFDWNHLPFNPMKAVSDVFNDIPNGKEIKELQEVIRLFLQSCKELNAQEEGTNEMIIQMLNTMEPLVAYGLYWNPADVMSIIGVLVSLIDTKPEQFLCNNQGKVKLKHDKNILLFDLKTKAVNILYLFFVQFSYMALCKMVYEYGFLKGNKACQHDDSYVVPNDELKQLTFADPSYSVVAPLARQRLRYYLNEEGYDLFQKLGHDENPFVCSLIDLMQFEDDDLRVSSCKLLFAIYHAEKTLFSKAKISYIYTESSYNIYDRMVNLAVFADADKLLLMMLQGNVESGEEQEKFRKALDTLDELAEDFIVDGKDTQPNVVNQNIAYSTGLVNVLLEYVLYYCKGRNVDQTDLVTKACFMLQRAARGNKKVQGRLFQGYVDLLDAQVAPNAVAELITEIFTDNEELCRKVSESELTLVFHIASTSNKHEELFTTLQAIIKCSKSDPVLMSKFQDVLAKLFLESLYDTFSFLLVPGRREEFHLEMLKNPDPDNPRLVKMLNVCDLLSICAEGEKKFPEDVCQAIFSLEELVKILEDDAIPIERKKTFTSLLTEVYLISDRESLTAISTLAKNKGFWAHAEFAAQLMSCMADTIRNDFSIEPTEIQVLLYYLGHRHLSLRTWKQVSAGIMTTVTCGSQEILLTSVLFYVMEGFLPMITAFCNQLGLANMADINSKLIRELLTARTLSVLKAVGDGVVALANLKAIFQHSKPHIRLMCQCLWSLLFLVPSSEWPSLRDTRTTLLQWEGMEVDSRHPELNDAAIQEVEENKSFMNFVETYEQAYTYSEEQIESDSMIGAELVVRDPSFAELIKCFFCDVSSNARIEQLKYILKFLDVLYQLLQQPLAVHDRNSLDSLLFSCLRLLSGVVYFYSTKKYTSTGRALPQGAIVGKELTKSEHEEMVKKLQDDLVTIKPQGAHESVVTHLAHPQDKVAGQAMAFLAALVYNGNEKAQQKIGQCVRNRDTELFTRMDAILEMASAHIKADPSRVIRRTNVAPKEEGEEPVTPEVKEGIELMRLQSTKSTEQSALVQRKSVWQLEANDETKRHLVVILDLVAWMCDGQKMENQELFREQESQFNSVNLVSQIAVLLQVVVEPLTDEYIPIARKAIQALIELCAGNFSNQQTAFKAQIVETINSILRRRDTGPTECQELLELKSSALELMNVLLEETSSESFDLLWGISQDIDTDTILDAMLDLWETNQSDPTREDARKGMFDAFHILKKIADNLKKPLDKYVEFDEQVEAKDDRAASFQAMWQDVKMWSRSIEVVYHTEEQKEILTRVYFPFDPQEQMSDETKDFISGKIQRGSPEDKVKDLLEWMDEVYKKMNHKKFVKHNRLLRWSSFLSGPRQYTLIFLTLLLNLLTIIFFQVPTNEAGETVDDHNNSVFTVTARILDVPLGYYVALYLLGPFHFILSCWMLAEYYVTLLPNMSFRVPFMEELLWESKKWMLRNSLQSDLSNNKILNVIQRPREQEHFDIYFFSFGPIYRILFTFFSLLSLAFSGYWYSGCLLYLFLNIVVLDQVLTALHRSALQLVIVFLLGLCITFMYAVISFAFFHAYFDRESGLFCETLAECFATVTREGLLDTLGTAIPLQAVGQDNISRSSYVWRLFIDLSFFIIVTTIGLNVVVAILVDTFSELRQQRDEINEDRKNYCFICGIENDTFERKAEGFHKHITEDHHMWNYIYFYLHLRKVKPSDHNAMEKYVYDQIEKKSIQFFPLRKAKVLVDQEKASLPKNGGSTVPGGQKDGSAAGATN